MALAAVAAGLSVASGVAGFFGSKSAADKAKSLTRQQLWAKDQDTIYNRRVLQEEQERFMGEMRASWGASNLLYSGTTRNYFSAVEAQLNREMQAFEDQALAERKAIRYGGKATASGIRNQGISSLLGSAGQAVSYYGMGK